VRRSTFNQVINKLPGFVLLLILEFQFNFEQVLNQNLVLHSTFVTLMSHFLILVFAIDSDELELVNRSAS